MINSRLVVIPSVRELTISEQDKIFEDVLKALIYQVENSTTLPDMKVVKIQGLIKYEPFS